MTSAPAPTGKGLEGVVLGDSTISNVEGTIGRLSYRGYLIQDLAANSSFEEVLYLIINGELPNKAQLDTITNSLKSQRELPAKAMEILRALPTTGEPIDVLRTITSTLALMDQDLDNTSHDAVIDKAITLAARMPTIAAAYDRLRNGKEPVAPNKRPGSRRQPPLHAHGEEPSAEDASALNTYFVLAAEHSFNASTFTAKVVISTLSDYMSAITAALCSLKGAAHGGANQKAMEMMMEIGSVENVEPFIDHALATKRRLMGMGHRIYKTYDPRAAHLNEHARIIAERSGNNRAGTKSPRRSTRSRAHTPTSPRARSIPTSSSTRAPAPLHPRLRARYDARPLRLQPYRRLDRPHPGATQRQPHHPPQRRLHRPRHPRLRTG